MATVKTNVLIKGLSGKFGNLVFRTIRDKTFVSARGSKPNKKKETDAQRNTRATFKEATEWAKAILRNPDKKAYYQKRANALQLPNAYTAAITDYMRKPKIVQSKQRDTTTYSITKPGFTLKQVRMAPDETTGSSTPKVKIRQQGDRWALRYKPNTEMAHSPRVIVTDNFGNNTELPLT
jgi:hypothetical protein